jgi:hypothetical protein
MLYDLRIYEHAEGCAIDVRLRFEKEVAPRFAEHGIELVGAFTDAQTGMLTYITRFQDVDAQAKAWKSFGEDSGWLAAKALSEAAGPLVVKQRKSVLIPFLSDLPIS